MFLCNGYGSVENDVMIWGDAPKLDASERRTDDAERTRYTVRIDQYKAMQRSLHRLVNTQCLFPDPQALIQEVHEKEARQTVAILKDMVFLHFQKTALVTERINDGERKLRRSVKQVGIDPHFSYANMLCDIAWARSHGSSSFILPPNDVAAERRDGAGDDIKASGLPSQFVGLMERIPIGRVCGRCEFYPMGPDGPPLSAKCSIVNATTRAKDPGCPDFEPIET